MLDRFDRRLSTISRVAAGLVIAFVALGWTFEDQRARLSPLLVAATLLLLGAAVTGIIGLRRPALHDDLARGARDKQLLTESTQNLFLDLGLIAAVAWLVELAVLALAAR